MPERVTEAEVEEAARKARRYGGADSREIDRVLLALLAERDALDEEIARLREREDTFERELMRLAGDDPSAREFAAKLILAGKEPPCSE